MEYADAIKSVNEKMSTDYCTCVHNNMGWLGFYVTTPNDKYCVVKNNNAKECYTINKYVGGLKYPPELLSIIFDTPQEAIKYIEENRM